MKDMGNKNYTWPSGRSSASEPRGPGFESRGSGGTFSPRYLAAKQKSLEKVPRGLGLIA